MWGIGADGTGVAVLLQQVQVCHELGKSQQFLGTSMYSQLPNLKKVWLGCHSLEFGITLQRLSCHII